MTSEQKVLSSEDCNQILQTYLKSNDFEVINYDLQPFSQKVNGFMSDHLLLIITYISNNAKTEVRLFAKQFPYNYELHSRYALSIEAFPNEIFTYSELFERFRDLSGFDYDIAPKYYFGKDDMLILENLSEKGFVTPECSIKLSLEQLKLALKTVSQYHTVTIGYQELKSKKLGKRYRLIEDRPNMKEPIFRKDEDFLGYHWCKARLNALLALVDLLPPSTEITPQKFKQALKELGEKSFEIMIPKEKYYNTLCHGDSWPNNFMFRYVNGFPVECKLIDFQLHRYVPPAHDVLLLIYTSTTAETRKCHLQELLRYYHDCLKLELKKCDVDLNEIIPFENFEVSVSYLLPQIKLHLSFYLQFLAPNQDSLSKVVTGIKDFQEIFFEDGVAFAVALYESDPTFKAAMIQTFDELKDLVVHQKLTKEDIFATVERKLGTTNYELLDYSLKPLGKVKGFLGDHYKLTVNVLIENRTRTFKFFLKCVPESKTRFDMAMGSRAFVKEFFVFRTLIPLIEDAGVEEIGECVAKCYLTRLNDVVIMDDLEHFDFEAGNPRVPFSFDHLDVLVKKLAIYHASNIIVEERTTAKQGKPFRLDYYRNGVEESFYPTETDNDSSISIKKGIEIVPYQIDLFPDICKDVSPEVFKAKALKAFEAVYSLVKPSKKFRNVICHGDPWAGNLMIKYENGKPVDCRLIDYQILRYCPPSHDLMCLIYLTTTRQVRAQYQQKLIDIYYEEFAKMLNKYGCNVDEIYSYDCFVESCEYMLPQAVCQTVLCYHMIMMNSDIIKDSITDEEYLKKIFLQDRRDYMKDMCQRDSVYKQRIWESLLDLKEMCFKYF